jgi:hypothetical protein
MRSEVRGSGEFGFVVPHRCAQRPAHGWGTQFLWVESDGEAGPSTVLRSAQDDSL